MTKRKIKEINRGDSESRSANQERSLQRCILRRRQKVQEKFVANKKRKISNQIEVDQNKRRKLVDQIAFSRVNAKDRDLAMFEVRQSRIPKAGNGVFVSGNQPTIPKNTVLPYEGHLSTEFSSDDDVRRYQVQLKNGLFFHGVTKYKFGYASGNWVNRPIRDRTVSPKYGQTNKIKRPQNLYSANSNICSWWANLYPYNQEFEIWHWGTLQLWSLL